MSTLGSHALTLQCICRDEGVDVIKVAGASVTNKVAGAPYHSNPIPP